MDELFTAYGLGAQGIGKVYVTSQGLLDKTGTINPDADQREMLISTISKMTARSEAFVFVNYNPRDPEELYKHLTLIAGDKSEDFVLPNYEIVAAITELNENVSSASLGLSVAVNNGDRPSIEALFHFHHRDAGLAIARHDGALDRRCAAPARQQRAVQIEATQRKQIENRFRQD